MSRKVYYAMVGSIPHDMDILYSCGILFEHVVCFLDHVLCFFKTTDYFNLGYLKVRND